MPIDFLKRKLPNAKDIKRNPYLQVFGRLLHDENLWHFNKTSLSRAIFIGLFWACIPIPFQMILAAGFAIFFRANLPLSIMLVWVSNPFTIPPMFYFNYLVGLEMLGQHNEHQEFELTLEWLTNSMSIIWQPLFLGSFTVGIILGLIGLVSLQILFKCQNKSKKKK